MRRIREVRAETVVACDPTTVFFENRYYNHSDHRASGFVALDASYPGSGNPHFFPEQLAEGLADPGRLRPLARMDERTEPRGGHHRLLRERRWMPSRSTTASSRKGSASSRTSSGKDAVEAGEKIGVEHAEEFRVLDLS